MKSVFIVGGDAQYERMFLERGWRVFKPFGYGKTDQIKDVDLIQFTGGEDVTPALYGERMEHRTYSNLERDLFEIEIYCKAVELGLPMAGICRGGQFLHVMNGGKLFQHIDGHGIAGLHTAWEVEGFKKKTGKTVEVSSTHHQAMKVDYALQNVIPVLIGEFQGEQGVTQFLEACFHTKTKCFCYQPHPEFNSVGIEACRDYYFEQVEHLLKM